MGGNDITPRFSLDEIDHHELLDVLTSRYRTSWRVRKHAITFPATADYKIKVQISHGQVERVFAGNALTDAELGELLAQVEADLKDDRIAEYGVDLDSNWPVPSANASWALKSSPHHSPLHSFSFISCLISLDRDRMRPTVLRSF